MQRVEQAIRRRNPLELTREMQRPFRRRKACGGQADSALRYHRGLSRITSDCLAIGYWLLAIAKHALRPAGTGMNS
jgi:hypothetical protein